MRLYQTVLRASVNWLKSLNKSGICHIGWPSRQTKVEVRGGETGSKTELGEDA